MKLAKENSSYFKLSFIETFSKLTENKLQKLGKQFCKEGTNIEIVFSTFKLTSFFHMVKILKVTGTSAKPRSANQLVMRTVF